MLGDFFQNIRIANGMKTFITDPDELHKIATVESYGGLGIAPEPHSADYEETYKTVSYVYRAAGIVARSIAQLPVVIERKVGDEYLDVTDQPDFSIFKTYNEFQTSYDFWEAALLYLLLTGESPWLKQMTAEGMIEAMYPISPSFLDIVPVNDFQIDHFIFVGGSGKRIHIPADDISFFKFFNPNNPVRGLSPLSAAREDIILDLDAVQTNKTTYRQGMKPSGVFSTDQALGDKPWKRIKDHLTQQYTGVHNAGKPIMLDHGMDFKKIALSNQDMQYLEQRQWSKDTVAEVYGVPPIFMMDFKEASVLANAGVQEKLFWSTTITSLTMKLNMMFTEFLLPEITKQKDVRFRFDLGDVPALQPDKTELSERYERGLKNGASTPNEYRTVVLGLEEHSDPLADQLWVPMNMIPMGTEIDDPGKGDDSKSALADYAQAIAKASGVPLAEATGLLLDKTTRNVEIQMMKASAISSIYRLVTKLGPKFAKDLHKAFKKQEKEVLSNINSNKSLTMEAYLRELGIHYEEIEPGSKKYTVTGVQFNMDEWNAIMQKIGEPYIADALYIAGGELSEELGEKFAENPASTAWVEGRSIQYAELINTTTADAINALVAEGLAEGLSVEEMAARLTTYFNNNSLMRATRIARTEMVMAGNKGRLDSMKQSKVVKSHMWATQRDGDVRDSHQDMDGTVVKVGASFPGNDGADSSFPSSVNERCFTIPIKEKKKPKKG